ncbi:MAG: sterol desaturase family protein [Lysobacterales bacterium]
MSSVELLALAVPLSFVLMLLIERRWPARAFPAVRHWHWIGAALFIYAGVVNSLLPALLPSDWLRAHSLLHLHTLGLWPSVLIAHLLITLVTYTWHRATHASPLLWRLFHQMHHAPRHLNLYAANLLHPADLAMYVILPTAVALFVLGLDPWAAAIVGNLGALNAFFQHWNVRTPRWLGYFVQRPEAHCIHHQRGYHQKNYSDLPLWDWLFGTYENPRTWAGDTGFDAPADARYLAMLAGVDVNATTLGTGSIGQARPNAAAPLA